MDDLNDKILRYDLLDEAERAAVDAHVKAHPELEALRDQGIAVGRLIAAGPRLLRDDPDDEALAQYVVTARLHGVEEAPGPLQDAYARIERRIESDPALQARVEQLEARYRELTAASDPAAQFARLTGRTLAPEAPAEERLRFAGASDERNGAPAPAPDRPAARIYRLQTRLMRWGVAALLAGIVAYVVGIGLQPPLERLAWASSEVLNVDGYTAQFRGETPAVDDDLTADAAYVQGVARLREAQVTTFGLFPRFRERPLEHAEALFRLAAADDEAPFVQNEARYLLAKVLLARGRPDEARAVLQEVVTASRNKTAEAQALLDALPAG